MASPPWQTLTNPEEIARAVSILPNIFPETQRIIDLLGTSTLSPLSMDTIITEEEFITGYKVVRR